MGAADAKLSIFSLGGLGEVGKNMMVVKYGANMVVIDAGMTFPEDEMLGVDIVIPDISYLIDNKEIVKGIFIHTWSQKITLRFALYFG